MILELETKQNPTDDLVSTGNTALFRINQLVKTPIGEGRYQGRYKAVFSAIEKCLIRIEVNEQTVQHLQDSSCITPRAVKQALFIFSPSELGAGWVEYLILVAFVAFLVLCLGPYIAAWLGVPWPL